MHDEKVARGAGKGGIRCRPDCRVFGVAGGQSQQITNHGETRVPFGRVARHSSDVPADQRMFMHCRVVEGAALLRTDPAAEAIADAKRDLADGARSHCPKDSVDQGAIERCQRRSTP